MSTELLAVKRGIAQSGFTHRTVTIVGPECSNRTEKLCSNGEENELTRTFTKNTTLD